MQLTPGCGQEREYEPVKCGVCDRIRDPNKNNWRRANEGDETWNMTLENCPDHQFTFAHSVYGH